ncbi:ImmA/IrrE family metallo-endopeptidase [Hoeflea poritis]|uniref:ImmA/IrrE family metallo-endopeptidase n=1 Tax=Hoeflea poritis TaxID=2993659 RepID=A0ABT4VUM9_9HYPH|nr:ImmA/IrrE family metallo-endopeptidase [Hoeflea poritis]MDA4848413.1 ImmA/IrrE family metallo-endopeptidase [Hoeflea poritis]
MGHKFKHGFKAEAERYAEEFREELGLTPDAPMCPRKLASHLEIPIFGIKDNPVLPAEITRYWANHPKDPFSGLIISDNCYKEIHHNDFHHPRRQNSDLAHELAHIILGHDLNTPIKDNGERAYDRNTEEEAKWLGATLLLPKKATLMMVLNSYNREKIENEFEVSWALYQYRLQVTDTVRAAKNIRKKYAA